MSGHTEHDVILKINLYLVTLFSFIVQFSLSKVSYLISAGACSHTKKLPFGFFRCDELDVYTWLKCVHVLSQVFQH